MTYIQHVEKSSWRRRRTRSRIGPHIFLGRKCCHYLPTIADRQGLGVEPATRLTTWGNSSSIPNGDEPNQTNGQPSLAHDGPVLPAGDDLDPAGAVTARTVEAGPSHVGEGTPSDEEGSASGSARKKRSKRDDSEADSTRKRGKRSISVDSDDLDDTPAASTPVATKNNNVKPGPLKAVGGRMACGECGKNFTVVSLALSTRLSCRLNTPKNIPILPLPTYVSPVATLLESTLSKRQKRRLPKRLAARTIEPRLFITKRERGLLDWAISVSRYV